MLESLLPINKEVEWYSDIDADSPPDVSVIVTTYNHENYIEKCIESILQQKGEFTFEIIIGEDDSKDETRRLCKELADKYKGHIRLALHNRENVIIANGKVTARFNFLYCLTKAKGRYIALCDGDDYWTDPFKIQKQVSYLKSNPDYSATCHWVDIIYENSDRIDRTKFRYKGDIDLDKIISQRWITIQTGSILFRSNLITGSFINMMLDYKGGSGDSILFAYLAKSGSIRSIEEVMSVYRKHEGGRTNNSDKIFTSKEERKFRIRSFKGLILLLDEIDNLTSGEKRAMINKYRTGLRFDILLAKLGLKRGNIFSRGFKKIMKI